FALVRETLRRALRIGNVAEHGHDGEIAEDLAARTGEVRQTEAGDLRVAVQVTARGRLRRRIRAPLQHPKRRAGARKIVDQADAARAAGTDERIDQFDGIVRCRRGPRARMYLEQREKENGQNKAHARRHGWAVRKITSPLEKLSVPSGNVA